jgi:hypothetical protein
MPAVNTRASMLSEVRQNGANPLAKPVRVHIKRESGLRVALFRR